MTKKSGGEKKMEGVFPEIKWPQFQYQASRIRSGDIEQNKQEHFTIIMNRIYKDYLSSISKYQLSEI